MEASTKTSSSSKTDCTQVRRIRSYAWFFAVAWTLLLLASATLTVKEHNKTLSQLARAEARTAINRDILYRSWGSSHGGVYAPISDKNPPNPYLKEIPERDISTPSGRKLTLVNPAYMTRQVYELAAEKGLFSGTGHLTSLKPIRPENSPDPWERRALESFDKGGREFSEIIERDGKPFMRLIQAFVTEKSCLRCHAVQGYKEGDVRGGLSVSLPIQPLIDATSRHLFNSLATHAAIWLLGLIMTAIGAWQLILSSRSQKRSEDQLEASLSMLNATLEATADGLLVTDLNGHITRWNQTFADLWHIPEGLMNSKAKYPVTRHIAAQVNQPKVFYRKVLKLYNNPQVASVDTLQLVDGRCFRRFSQPQRIGDAIVGRVWSFDDITDQKRAEEALEESNRKLEIMSLTDGLTSIANRRHFDATLSQEISLHIRSEADLSLILLDIDHFKAFNDCYGHVAGDDCLKQIARVIADNTTRPTDLAARYGGEEFACILPSTNANGAAIVAEKIRHSIQSLAIPHEQSGVADCVTASLGVITVKCTMGISVQDIITRVDDLLYIAKSSGRNRVEQSDKIL